MLTGASKLLRNTCTVRRPLKRRGQRDKTTWTRAFKLAAEWLPGARILHPWPNQQFHATHPRQEPDAGILYAGICAGEPSNLWPYRE